MAIVAHIYAYSPFTPSAGELEQLARSTAASKWHDSHSPESWPVVRRVDPEAETVHSRCILGRECNLTCCRGRGKLQ